MNIKSTTKIFKILSDMTRLRILMLLKRKELCVCQIMAILGISQPLISRNLSILNNAGFLDERKEGKLVFYSIKKDLPSFIKRMLGIIMKELKDDKIFTDDLKTLADCYEYQKKSGRCDMRTFLAFMEERRKKRRNGR
jgi:ArsR family transcriptional regulator